jgi:hypothetical protein
LAEKILEIALTNAMRQLSQPIAHSATYQPCRDHLRVLRASAFIGVKTLLLLPLEPGTPH